MRLAIGIITVFSCMVIGKTPAQINSNADDQLCMAEAIYHEARGESVKGQVAVAQVILNRVERPNWPKTICEVIYQPDQFSYTLNINRRIDDKLSWELAMVISKYMIERRLDVSEKIILADHYHASYVKPKWAKKLKFVDQIGAHLFYQR